MKLAPYLNIVEGLSPAGLIIAGAVVGAATVPYLKKGVKGVSKGLSNNLSAVGRKLKHTAVNQTKWWNSVVEEARSRRESKIANRQNQDKPNLKFGVAGDF